MVVLSSLAFASTRFITPETFLSREEIRKRSLYEKYGKEKVEKYISPLLFKNNHVLAYYGHPKSKIMGIVGRMKKEPLAKKLIAHAKEYDRLNGPQKGVVPAIYLIYATAQPKGRVLKMQKKLLQEYIDFTLENGFLLYIDHQIGVTSLKDMMKTLLPYLKYPHVHLAFDVEWRTDRPMKEIGFIYGKEINFLQKQMQSYIEKNNIFGVRQLVFHQFHKKMVQNPAAVKTNFKQVMLVHSTSGWGPPGNKLSTHARNAKAITMPHKAFKLWFYYSDRKGVHYDKPIMKPRAVLDLKPEPGLIIYQ